MTWARSKGLAYLSIFIEGPVRLIPDEFRMMIGLNGWLFEAASPSMSLNDSGLSRFRDAEQPIFFCDFVPVFFRPIAACLELCLDRVALDLLL